jgi:hypothetical protein
LKHDGAVHLPFLDPVFDNRQSLFGLPTDVLLLAVAAGLSIAGWLIARRITGVDPEPRSFRATTRLEASDLITRVVVVGLVGIAAIAAVSLLLRR